MSEGTFNERITRLEKHIKSLINQPICEFQENEGIKISKINIFKIPSEDNFSIDTIQIILDHGICKKCQWIHSTECFLGFNGYKPRKYPKNGCDKFKSFPKE